MAFFAPHFLGFITRKRTLKVATHVWLGGEDPYCCRLFHLIDTSFQLSSRYIVLLAFFVLVDGLMIFLSFTTNGMTLMVASVLHIPNLLISSRV